MYNNMTVNWVNEWVESAQDFCTDRILLVGDSVTRNIHNAMQKYIFPNKEYLVDLLACSVPIEDTQLMQLQTITQLDKRKYLAVFIFVTHHMRKYDLDAYKSYTEYLFKFFNQYDLNIFLVGASRVKGDEEWTRLMFARNDLFRQLADEKKCQYIDIEEAVQGTEHYVDNIHYDAYMNKKLSCMLAKYCCAQEYYDIVNQRWKYIQDSQMPDAQIIIAKNHEIIEVLSKWFALKQQGKNVADYLLNKKCKSVAIYGMGHLGKILWGELKDSQVEVKYLIDSNPDAKVEDASVVLLSDNMETVDAVIVTPFFAFEGIKDKISSKLNGRIVSIKDIVDEMR